MKRFLCVIITAIFVTGCAIGPVSAPNRATDNPVYSKPTVVLQDELLNEPPQQPRFIIAQPPISGGVELTITQVIRQQLLDLGYEAAQTRQDANVVVWYRYTSKPIGQRQVGDANDVWGEQLAPIAVTDPRVVRPTFFHVEIISLQESQFPDLVMKVWKGEWNSSVPQMNMLEFAANTLPQVFAQYQSEHTRSQIAAFAQARERKMQQAINTYMKLVMYRIQSNWKKPKYNVKGKTCKVRIVQSLVGDIKSHKLLTCDKDRRFRKSIVKAIKASSPLPMPQEKEELFDRREIILIFQG